MGKTTQTLPKAVLFDWDGTLVDSYAFLERAHNQVLGSFGMEALAPSAFTAYFGQPREFVYTALYGDRAEEAKPVFAACMEENRHLLQPMPGARELLECIAGHGIPLGVVSNKRKDFILSEIGHLGWADLFAVVIGAGEAAQDKPHAAPLLKALEHMGVEADVQAVWYVGDTPLDLECALGAGCRPFIIKGGHSQIHKFPENCAPELFGDCFLLRQSLLPESRGGEKETCR